MAQSGGINMGLKFGYSGANMAGDYFRAGLGLLLTAGPAALLPARSVGFWILAVLASLFVGLVIHTMHRHKSRIEITDKWIESFPGGKFIAWDEVTKIRLSYYSTRKDRTDGWMQLIVESNHNRLRMDSRIDDFHAIASRVLECINGMNVEMDETTSANFQAMNLNPRVTVKEENLPL